MKKLVKLILLCLIAYPIISIVSSCSEEEDCSMNARPMMECYLYTVDRESKRVFNDTLDSLTITAFDTDSVILNNQKKVHSLSFPAFQTGVFCKRLFLLYRERPFPYGSRVSSW